MTAEEKTQYLATLIALIHVDGKIQKSEERLLNTVAREIGAGFHFLEQAEKAVQSGDVSSQPPPRAVPMPCAFWKTCCSSPTPTAASAPRKRRRF